MKKLIAIFLVSLIGLSLANCGGFGVEEKNTGAIIEDFKQVSCMSIKTYTNDACVVTSPLDFDTVQASNCTLNIDLNAHSVIGKTITFGCNAKFVRELEIIHEKKQYIYTIKYKESGLCKRMGTAFNLVLVPKIPADYSVLFVVKKE